MKMIVSLLTIAFISAMVSCRSQSSLVESKTDSISSYSLSLATAVSLLNESISVNSSIDSITFSSDSSSSSIKIFGIKHTTITSKRSDTSATSAQASSTTAVSNYYEEKESGEETKDYRVSIDLILIAIALLIGVMLYRWYRCK